MKIWKYMLMLATVAATMTSCLYGIGSDEAIEQEKRLSLTASTSVIYANGTDEVVLTAKFGDRVLTEEEITLYDGITKEPVSLPGLKFTTETPGEYSFYAFYIMGDEDVFTSNIVTISAIKEVEIDVEERPGEEGLTISTSNTIFEAGNGFAALVVRKDGKVLNAADVTIYDADTTTPFEGLETMEVKGYTLPVFRSTKAGTYRFFAEYKVYQSPVVSVSVVGFAIPPRMEDPNPEKLDFKRRIMLIDHTGSGCKFCPYMLAALDDISHDDNYKDKFVLTAVHSFAGDPLCPDNTTTSAISNAMGVTSWPTVIFDMASYIGNVTYEANKANLMSIIDSRLAAAPAKAGISATMAMGNGLVVVRMTIKAAEAGRYAVGAWLLEDNLYAAQLNAGMSEDGYDFSNHNHVARWVDSGNSFVGHPVNEDREVAKGELVDYLFQIPISDEYKIEDCYLCLFVTTPGQNGAFSVTNVVTSKSLTESVNFEYAE